MQISWIYIVKFKSKFKIRIPCISGVMSYDLVIKPNNPSSYNYNEYYVFLVLALQIGS